MMIATITYSNEYCKNIASGTPVWWVCKALEFLDCRRYFHLPKINIECNNYE